ncbi:WD domain, G-beta repeat protein [Ancylostoma ceylanicum]|uniref:WD domain, G-beta repeat protein n=1 Tax=Ancylostoma ceylanicum TaxID=53326 RepID=A0A0D6LJG0_9BILA|nr:WD domain, G-beta repeat protein [Ancylostoma ceylanicum]
MVAMVDTEEVDDYTVICKQKNVRAFSSYAWISWCVVVSGREWNRWSCYCRTRLCETLENVGLTKHHSLLRDEAASGAVTLSSKVEMQEWRTAVQSADVTSDGKCICLVTVDSMFYEIILGDEGPVVMPHDFGVMEAWHVRIAKSKTNYITTAFSGYLKEIDLNGKISRQEPFPSAKTAGALAYGNSSRRLAISTFEGILHIFDASTLKSETTIEAHSKRVRALAFLPGDDEILTGSDDKTIKLHSVGGERPKVERIYCGHRSSVLSLAIDDRADGSRFASSSLDGQILLWHIEQPTALQQLPSPHTGAVTTVTFVPTGRHLVSGGEDGVVACYRIPQAGMTSPGNIEQEEENNMKKGMGTYTAEEVLEPIRNEKVGVVEEPRSFVSLRGLSVPSPARSDSAEIFGFEKHSSGHGHTGFYLLKIRVDCRFDLLYFGWSGNSLPNLAACTIECSLPDQPLTNGRRGRASTHVMHWCCWGPLVQNFACCILALLETRLMKVGYRSLVQNGIKYVK